LGNGQVLVAAGNYSGPLSSAELYNPSTGTWSTTGSLGAPRYDYTMTLLPSGRVLAVGGRTGGGVVSAAEIYTPVSIAVPALPAWALLPFCAVLAALGIQARRWRPREGRRARRWEA
jgi:hypothetical protein